MQCPSRIEVFLNDWQQIPLLGLSLVRSSAESEAGFFRYEWVLEGFVGGHALIGVDGETAFDEFACRGGDAAPVFEWGEGVVCHQDCLHLFEVGVAVKWGVAAKEEVCYYAYGPYISTSKRASRGRGRAFS